MTAALDVITIGRSSVDLYGEQIGGRLEDMATFAKSVGGCPSNIAIGSARLGLKPGLITRVGDEHMGRFIREQMEREGVVTDGIVTDPVRLTALVILGVRDDETFPLIFYRENCADMALCEDDIDPGFIASAKAVVVTGTHLSTETVDAASRKAIRAAKAAGRKVAFDIDYRPNLWGLAGHGAGEERFIASAAVSEHLSSILPDCDLVVGTEEEIHIAAGKMDTLEAIRAIRAVSDATIVCKRGPMGCVVLPDAIPDSLDEGIRGPGFPVEVYNVLGAGDAFMSGFLRGWLRDEPFETCATWANACGAFAVSRLLCSPESPTWTELQHFLENGSPHRALRHDADLNHVHHATTRRGTVKQLCAFAFDHRAQLEAIADKHGADESAIGRFKRLAVDAAVRVATKSDDDTTFGILCDGRLGREALFAADRAGLWIGRPMEKPGSRPLRFEEGRDLGPIITEWPATHVAKCLAFYHPSDPPELREEQDERLLQYYEACRGADRECLIEIIAGKHGPLGDDTISSVLDHLYELGIRPDWWKLEPLPSATAWTNVARSVEANDPFCRGIVVLGLDAPESELREGFAVASACPHVRGFAVGRTIFGPVAEAWFAGTTGDAGAVDEMASRFAALVDAWHDAATGADDERRTISA